MKPQRFEIGQAVTMKNPLNWLVLDGPSAGSLALFGKIYHVKEYTSYHSQYRWLISFEELHPEDEFEENEFVPVISDAILESELSSINQTINV